MSNLVFKTFTPKTARIVAVITFLVGVCGVIAAWLLIKTGNMKYSLPVAVVAMVLTAIGVTGPMSVMLFTDKLTIRSGAWTRAKEFPLSEIREVNFASGKLGRTMTVRLKDAAHEFRFAQSKAIVELFSQSLKSQKVRVTGKK